MSGWIEAGRCFCSSFQNFEQCRHVGLAGAASVCDEVAPGTLAQLQILDLVQLGEARGNAGLDGTLAQEARAERMNRPGEEPLEIAQG